MPRCQQWVTSASVLSHGGIAGLRKQTGQEECLREEITEMSLEKNEVIEEEKRGR